MYIIQIFLGSVLVISGIVGLFQSEILKAKTNWNYNDTSLINIFQGDKYIETIDGKEYWKRLSNPNDNIPLKWIEGPLIEDKEKAPPKQGSN